MTNRSLGKTLAIIPAKGASKRLPRKNLRLLGGRSLLDWTVSTALATTVFDRVIVSTEDDVIAKEAKHLGAEVPFMRPQHLAVDPAGVVDVCLHTLERLEVDEGQTFETLVVLLPSSPFRSVGDIQEALNCYLKSGANFLMSVTKFEHSPLSSLILDRDGFLQPLHPDWIHRLGAKAKEVPNLVRCNGAVTVINVERFKQEQQYYAHPLAAYEMPWNRSLDIDTEQDLLFGGFLLERSLIE